MADDQESPNDVGEGGDAPEISDYEDTAATTTASAIEQTTISPLLDDYDDEPIEDYVVKLVVNEQPDGAISQDILDAAVTDINGNIISKAPFYDSIHGYTTSIYDELNGNGTAITGGKRWWGWSTRNLIIIGLIALAILAIILVVLFLVFGKKFKKNPRSPPASTTTTTKVAVPKNTSADPKYQPVPNV